MMFVVQLNKSASANIPHVCSMHRSNGLLGRRQRGPRGCPHTTTTSSALGGSATPHRMTPLRGDTRHRPKLCPRTERDGRRSSRLHSWGRPGAGRVAGRSGGPGEPLASERRAAAGCPTSESCGTAPVLVALAAAAMTVPENPRSRIWTKPTAVRRNSRPVSSLGSCRG